MSEQDAVRQTTVLIQKIIDTDQCKQLEKDDPNKYRDVVTQLFPTFAADYPSLFKLIIFRRDLSMLEMMLQKIEALKDGSKTEKEITTSIAETLAQKYVYPVVGKPESTTEKNPEFIYNDK
jgi:F0F1-type ATP synthase delta subunit